jgi:hypothetical protein
MRAGARTAPGHRGAAVDDRVEHCDLCGGARVFVPVYAYGDCPDGHTECPEWACADCGGAILIGFDLPTTRMTRVVTATRAA